MSSFIQAEQNHVVFVLDESSSMTKHAAAVPAAVDNEIAWLANRSKEVGQETRVSVYLFSSSGTARCVIYDMDVLRVPTIKGLYKPNGMTSLCDATVLAVEDLKLTPQKYNDHAFWFYVFTDGMENASTLGNRSKLPVLLSSLPDNWTFVTFVPDPIAKGEAKRFGFPNENIVQWDTTSVRGMEEVAKTVRKASESFFTMRSKGIRGSKSIFSLRTLTPAEIVSNLTPVPVSHYVKLDVHLKQQIRPFVQDHGLAYTQGVAYYQLTKNEHVQPQKSVLVEYQGRLYGGSAARQLLGLPDEEVLVEAQSYPDYTIYIQSKSVNRNLIPGQRLIVITGNILSNFFR